MFPTVSVGSRAPLGRSGRMFDATRWGILWIILIQGAAPRFCWLRTLMECDSSTFLRAGLPRFPHRLLSSASRAIWVGKSSKPSESRPVRRWSTISTEEGVRKVTTGRPRPRAGDTQAFPWRLGFWSSWAALSFGRQFPVIIPDINRMTPGWREGRRMVVMVVESKNAALPLGGQRLSTVGRYRLHLLRQR